MNWSAIASDFVDDGFLRDICIFEASIDDWTSVWAALTETPERLSFEVDGVATAPPTDVKHAFELRTSHLVIASYRNGKQLFNSHFFREDVVEFDLDPRAVTSLVEAERLTQFLSMLGRVIGKEVRLTAENTPEAIIAHYDPEIVDVVWTPITR